MLFIYPNMELSVYENAVVMCVLPINPNMGICC